MTTTFWILLAQDVSRPIGGIKQIFRLASALHQLNYSVKIVQKSSDFRPDWFSFPNSLDLVSLSTFNAHIFDVESDVVIIPETFITYYFKLPRVRKVIFNQNFGYTFGERLDIDESLVFQVYNDSFAYVLCVSLSDYLSVTRLIADSPERVGTIVNPIETDLFSSSFPKDRSIIYMPRKNPHHSRILSSFIKRAPWFNAEGWTLNPIDKLSLSDVASLMQKAFIFLSFGYPEGFGLPIAEALSCGCIVVGYSGVGGSELFDISYSYSCSYQVNYLDFDRFVSAVSRAASLYPSQGNHRNAYLLQSLCSSHISSKYCYSNFVDHVRQYFYQHFPS